MAITTIQAEPWREVLFERLEMLADNWKKFGGNELSGAQEFLRRLLDIYDVNYRPGTIFEQHPVRVPAEGKPKQGDLFGGGSGPRYTTQRMDMYLPKICVWEMKSPREADLEKHHAQLLSYWARMRTRYMVLSNFREFWIYDTEDEDGQLVPKLKIPLAELPARADAFLFLRGELPDLPARAERVTAEVAKRLGRLVRAMVEAAPNAERDRERIARIMLQSVFAMFAEDTELIPAGLFTRAMEGARLDGRMEPVFSLFTDFATRAVSGRRWESAPFVNGPLFDKAPPRIKVSTEHVEGLYHAARDFRWGQVHPEIFGSIFEQALDPAERHELGAHFTRESDIARVVMPTLIEPWRDRIAQLRFPKEAEALIEQMTSLHILDPACGCGNFLYVAYREMKRLEVALRVKWVALQRKVAKRLPDIKPPPPGPWFTIHQLHGIERNGVAAFLARVVIWIGEHLANRELGLEGDVLPLKSLEDNIVAADALQVEWPRPDGELAIVGNPPYLGVRKLRRELGDEYVERLFERYPRNRAADYVTYWFTRALEVMREGERAGFVCTNSIAQNESRAASIDQIIEHGGTITDAWKSYPWPGEAAVHIGIVNWVMADWQGAKRLDGDDVMSISPALTAGADATTAVHIDDNDDICFMGVTPGNAGFVINQEQRDAMVADDPASEAVLRPFLIGRDVNRGLESRPSRWIIDFGAMDKQEASKYAGAMKHVRRFVYPVRVNNRRAARALNWWRFAEVAPNLRVAIEGRSHVLCIPCVSPRLIVSRQRANSCFDHQLMVVALQHWYHFGLLQSAIHQIWAWVRGSTHEERLRYTNTTIFETFPFPPQADGSYDPRKVPRTPGANALAKAAEAFDLLRSHACKDQELGLTKIHNQLEAGEMPELAGAYAAMNDAVCACYGWKPDTWRTDGEVLERLLALNAELAG